jgi:hypothetical protein
VSADFLTSDFILNEEVRRLLERKEKGGLHIFPVIVRDCQWRRVPWLGKLQAQPLDGKPLVGRRGGSDTELSRIAGEIAKILESAPPPVRPSRKDEFLATFRRRLAPEYSRWDLGTVGVTQSGGAGRPIETDLDVMYLPLRLAEGLDPQKTDRGALLKPEKLLARKQPLVIRGPAGAGKTTWMRWTFRKLLRMETAFPLMLVLRDLSARWQDRGSQGASRALDTFLESWIEEHGLLEWKGVLPELLGATDGPRPVLLVDGWDELGSLGDEMRSKLLGFLEQYPRVLAVVTSRPYGEGRPSHAERFQVLDIQPLSDGEIAEFTQRFFTHCHGEEESAIRKNAEHFARALEHSPDAQALARTALLLTMMLLISRSRPLPDKRHLLYEACIENLLTALPNRKEQEGARLGREQWRPDDSEERMRVVAEFAARLQRAGYVISMRSTLVYSWDVMAVLLPSWKPDSRRQGFLAWLAGPAGLLTDRADGKLAFTHLSFQEYLTAWHLNATFEGTAERVEAFRSLLENSTWWETLRLWAALIEKQNRQRLDAVLTALAEENDLGFSLVGTILADGLGTDERFRRWLDRLVKILAQGWPLLLEICAQAWSSSRQEERRQELTERLNAEASAQTWLGWLRYEALANQASLQADLPLQEIGTFDRTLISQLQGMPVSCTADMAWGRILSGLSPIWPLNPLLPGLLQVWPGRRRLAGLRLQVAHLSGGTRWDISQLAKFALQAPEKNRDWVSKARALTRYLHPDLARYLTRDLAVDLDVLLDRAGSWTPDWDRFWNRDSARDSARDLARDWARGWARDSAGHWATPLGLEPEQPWTRAFSSVELLSWGRAGARASLANVRLAEVSPESRLLSQAAKHSLNLSGDKDSFHRLLTSQPRYLDPLWTALARHLARLSTPEDRALLIDLAQHPEKREPPLSWGLQFIVRGDVMLADGSIVTLDELADEAGLPRLPFLEEMEDELEVDW